MAHLLLMYQYMRAKREYNELTAQSFKNQQKKSRIKKNIEKTQKYYTDAKARISSQAKLMQSNANSIFQSQLYGSSGMMSSYLDPSGYGRNNAAVQNIINAMFNNSNGEAVFNTKNADGTPGTPYKITQAQYIALSQAQAQGITLGQVNGSYDTLTEALQKINRNAFSTTDFEKIGNILQAFSAVQSQGNSEFCQRQQQVNVWKNNFDQNVLGWQQMMEAELEAQQDLALEPLNYEETMMELEETTIKASLEEKKEEMQNLKQELSERIKEDVPKFGLA